MIYYDSKKAALVNSDLRSVPVPWPAVLLTITTAWSALRWAYATYWQNDVLTSEITHIVLDVLHTLPGLDLLLIVEYPDRWAALAAVAAVLLAVVLLHRGTRRSRAKKAFYAATDANNDEKRLVTEFTDNLATLATTHGIGHQKINPESAAVTYVPPILRHITMGPAGLHIHMRPATGDEAYDLANQWSVNASIFKNIDFDTEIVGKNTVVLQIHTREGGEHDLHRTEIFGDRA